MIGIIRTFAFTGGEWVIYILILCSIVTVAVIIERSVVLSKEKKQLKVVKEHFDRLMKSGDYKNISSEFGQEPALPARVLFEGFSKISEGVPMVEESMASVISLEKRRLEMRMIILNTLGNNAVYIGLFGTVLGVIKAFKDLSEGTGAGPEVVMQGLSEALIATAVGLLVAIPCVIAYNYFQKEIKDIVSDTDSMMHILLAKLKTKNES